MLARNVYICIIIVPGRLCSGDNRSVANASHSFSPGSSVTWIQFTESTQLLVEFFVAKGHLRDGILFLLDVDQGDSWLCVLPSKQQSMSKYNSYAKPARSVITSHSQSRTLP